MQTNVRKFNLILLVILITIFELCITPTNVNASKVISTDDKENIKEVINKYFTIRYESRISQTMADFSSITIPSTASIEVWLKREQNHQEIELYKDKVLKIAYLDYEFSLGYKSITLNGTDCIVKLFESNKIFYKNRPATPSQIANLEHTLTLKKINEQWKISNDQYRDEIMQALDIMPLDEILERIKIKTNYQQELSINNQESGNIFPQSQLSRHYYNVQAAITYTATWWNGINPTYHDEPYNQDCTNFASQAIYEGTNHIMSTATDYYTDWYYDFYTHTGSLPWVRVNSIFTFLTTNTERGPYGINTGEYLCYLGPGDVVIMKLDGERKHTVVVRSVVQCHDPSQVYVDAHDVDSYNRPLSDYYLYDWEAIDIEGYRD